MIRTKLVSCLFVIVTLFFGLGISQGQEPVASTATSQATETPQITIEGDWTVQVLLDGNRTVLTVDPSDIRTFKDERHDRLTVFGKDKPAWRPAEPLFGVAACECSVENSVVDNKVIVSLKPDGEPLKEGQDYVFDPVSGNLGRTEDGVLGPETPVYVAYQAWTQRLDSIVKRTDGTVVLLRGEPSIATPVSPETAENELVLANIWVHGKLDRLTTDNLFPIQCPGQDPFDFNETSSVGTDPIAARLIPKTWAKLKNGEEVHILAWGDSVTDGAYLPESEHWQNQFVTRLQALFPQARLVLETEAWGGRSSTTYVNEPEGSPKNYREKVLNRHPDLIISEFVNDASMDEATVADQYGRLLRDFRENGMEWIICTPHYIRPGWMNLDRMRAIAEDPRPYVKALREFAEKNQVALADVSRLYGQLDLRGIPYLTLMTNNINHPTGKGLSLFASALINLFQ